MKILIAAHKPYQMPTSDIYEPIMVGAALHDKVIDGYTPDNTGQNMSDKNGFYNELTALYWAKYNLQDEDILGLAHYRRYLGRKASHDLADILSEDDIRKGLNEADILLPKQRNYFIETQEKHYLNAHVNEPYYAMREVLEEFYPDYVPAFDALGKSTKAHLFNMSVMRQDKFQAYTDFLFDVLGKVDERIDVAKYEGQDCRSLGFLAERLMDTWVNTQKLRVKEYPVVTTEKTNWLDKGTQFLKRKFIKNGERKVHF